MDAAPASPPGTVRRVAILAISGVIMAAFLGLLAFGLMNREPPTGRSGVTRVGKEAPAFDLPTLEGATLASTDLRGTPVVLNFWASWCPPCRAELPLLVATSQRYAGELRFVGVNIQDTLLAASSTAQSYALSYPNVHDASSRIAVDYGVVGLPVTFFIDADGIVVRRAVGALSPQTLEAALAELLTGVEAGSDIINDGEFFEF